MKESTLLKLSLASSLIGILILLFIVQSTELPITEIKDIDKSKIDTIIKVKGTIQSISETPGLYIINLKDKTGEITAIIFKEEEIQFYKNQELEIKGQITVYKDKLEIIAKQIKNVS